MSTDAPALPPRAPTPAQMRTFALLSATYVALTLALVPWARDVGTGDPHIVVAYGLAIAIADLCTALMLGALYRDTGRIAHLLLCCAYLYGGLMAGAAVAAFFCPLFPRRLVGDPPTPRWRLPPSRPGCAWPVLAP